MATKRQQNWQAERRARGECRQCGQPAALKADGTPGALCDLCKVRYKGNRKSRATNARQVQLQRRVLTESWQCPDHPNRLPMPSRYNLGEFICTIWVWRYEGGVPVRRPCYRKSTDEPLKTARDEDIIRGKGYLWTRLMEHARLVERGELVEDIDGEMVPPSPPEPRPLAQLLESSEYFRWHYRMYQCMPWERSA